MKIVKGIGNNKINQVSDILYDAFKKKLNIFIVDISADNGIVY